MITLLPRAFLFVLALTSLAYVAPLRAAGDEAKPPMVLVTGTLRGVYFPVGSALCRLFNAEEPTGARCVSLRSKGSVANIESLRRSEAQIALVQSDTQTSAYRGSGVFKAAGPYSELRSLFALHDESVAVLVREGSHIREITELKGKRINIGHEGSGQHAVVESLLAAYGFTREDFAEYREKGPGQVKRFCAGELDALVFIGGNPNGLVTEATVNCNARLLPLAGPAVDRFLMENPELKAGVIPGGLYRDNPNDVPTVAVIATVVASASVPDEDVQAFVRVVFDNLDILRQLHPVLKDLDATQMVRAHGTAPLHPAAERFFRERGLITEARP